MLTTTVANAAATGAEPVTGPQKGNDPRAVTIAAIALLDQCSALVRRASPRVRRPRRIPELTAAQRV